eukprot:scaffold948_cov106-Cylindrotheca_fusiformis.AAC.1
MHVCEQRKGKRRRLVRDRFVSKERGLHDRGHHILTTLPCDICSVHDSASWYLSRPSRTKALICARYPCCKGGYMSYGYTIQNTTEAPGMTSCQSCLLCILFAIIITYTAGHQIIVTKHKKLSLKTLQNEPRYYSTDKLQSSRASLRAPMNHSISDVDQELKDDTEKRLYLAQGGFTNSSTGKLVWLLTAVLIGLLVSYFVLQNCSNLNMLNLLIQQRRHQVVDHLRQSMTQEFAYIQKDNTTNTDCCEFN